MNASERGRILPPNLDDRTWQDLSDEARAMIPTYAPQWTDHNPSDIGITLIELFSWMTEQLIYRLNRVPEKNYVAFLNLLGITRDPETPAGTLLSFRAAPVAPVLVPKGTQAQTAGGETEAPVIFETDEDVTILPANLAVMLSTEIALPTTYANVSAIFLRAPAPGMLVNVPAGQSSQFCLGFDAATLDPIRLRVQLNRPIQIDPPPGGPQASVTWLFSTGALQPLFWDPIPGVDDGTEGFLHNGIVTFSAPATWTSQLPGTWSFVLPQTPADTVGDPHFWVGVRITNSTGAPITVGIRSLQFNSVPAHNALTIPTPEPLGTSTGDPFQVFPLRHWPLYKRPDADNPYAHLHVEVAGTVWNLVPVLAAGAGNFFRINEVTGEILFGDFSPTRPKGHGSIPPAGAPVVAASYRYSAGGVNGNVGAGSLISVRTPVTSITGVTNLMSAEGGSDEEPIEETKRRAPEVFRNSNRAVTAADYEYLAREATTDVRIVRCLAPRLHDTPNLPAWDSGVPWTFAEIDRSPGNVNLIVVPDQGTTISRPWPTIDLLREVQFYLDHRRHLTARLSVTGPRYLPVRVDVIAFVWQKAIDEGYITTAAEAYIDIERKIVQFLHPIHGGLDGSGWQVGQHVFIADIFNAIKPPDEIGFISTLSLSAAIPAYHDPPLGGGGPWNPDERPFTLSVPGAWVRVTDFELVCFGSMSVPPQLPQ